MQGYSGDRSIFGHAGELIVGQVHFVASPNDRADDEFPGNRGKEVEKDIQELTQLSTRGLSY